MSSLTSTQPTLQHAAAESPEPSIPASEDSDDHVCWVCLEGSAAGVLRIPCQCVTRPVHAMCLARWQLQAAGKREETSCRFCNQVLPDWRQTLAPLPTAKPVRPVMAVRFQGKTYRLRVDSGPEGLKQFKEQVKALLGLEINDGCEVDFECKVPHTGERVKLTGIAAFSAATHCAAVTAAERKVRNLSVNPPTTNPPTETPCAPPIRAATPQAYRNPFSPTHPSPPGHNHPVWDSNRLHITGNSHTPTPHTLDSLHPANRQPTTPPLTCPPTTTLARRNLTAPRPYIAHSDDPRLPQLAAIQNPHMDTTINNINHSQAPQPPQPDTNIHNNHDIGPSIFSSTTQYIAGAVHTSPSALAMLTLPTQFSAGAVHTSPSALAMLTLPTSAPDTPRSLAMNPPSITTLLEHSTSVKDLGQLATHQEC